MAEHQYQTRNAGLALAQRLADTLKVAGDVSMQLADPEWCELIAATLPDDLSEDIETVKVCAISARVNVPGEIARLYLNPLNHLGFPIVRQLVRVALEPFTIGGRQFTVHDIPEGLVIALTDHGQVESGHSALRHSVLQELSPRRAANIQKLAGAETGPYSHWASCGVYAAKDCDCGGITVVSVLAAAAYHHAYNLASVLKMFRFRVIRRAFRLSQQAPTPPARWVTFRSPLSKGENAKCLN